MAGRARRKSKTLTQVASIGLAAIIVGVVIGALLAFVVTPFIRDICASAPVCQRQLSALIGGVALMQAFNIAIIYLLIDRLNRRREDRILSRLL